MKKAQRCVASIKVRKSLKWIEQGSSNFTVEQYPIPGYEVLSLVASRLHDIFMLANIPEMRNLKRLNKITKTLLQVYLFHFTEYRYM